MHKPTTWRKSRIPGMKGNSQRLYHYTHTFSVYIYGSYNAYNFGMEGSIKKPSRISLRIVIQCCAYLNNDKMCQVVGLCKYSRIYIHVHVMELLPQSLYVCIHLDYGNFKSTNQIAESVENPYFHVRWKIWRFPGLFRTCTHN